jgi:hypothetical protein
MGCNGKEVWCYAPIVNKYFTFMQVRQMKLTISARIVETDAGRVCTFHQKIQTRKYVKIMGLFL